MDLCTHPVGMIRGIIDQFDERLETPVQLNQVPTLILFGEPEDGAGTEHLELGVAAREVADQILDHSLRLHGQAVGLLGSALLLPTRGSS